MSKKIKIAFVCLIMAVLLLGISSLIYENREKITKVSIGKYMDIDIDYPDFAKVFVIGCERSASGAVTGGEPIPGEDLEAHKGGVFCKQQGGTIPYRYHGNASLKGSSKETDGTLEANSGSPASTDYWFEHVGNGTALVREYEGETFRKELSDQEMYTVAGYITSGNRDMTLAEQYVFSHKNNEVVQKALWELEAGVSGLPSGGRATSIAQEGKTYESVISNIIDPSLDEKGATTSYSYNKKEFLIGPFSVDYTRYYIFGCGDSEVASQGGRKN